MSDTDERPAMELSSLRRSCHMVNIRASI
jgi:hypothetical protein